MRISAGKYRGQKIRTIETKLLKPTRSDLREALFNILRHNADFQGYLNKDTIFLDLFCGSAIMSFEAFSHGVANAILVEQDHKLKKLFEENAQLLKNNEQYNFITAEAHKIASLPVQPNLIYMDPPYEHNLVTQTLDNLLEKKLVAADALIIIEVAKKTRLNLPPNLQICLEKIYGSSKLYFVKNYLTWRQKL